MKLVRSIFGGTCPSPPATEADGNRLFVKICQLFDFLQRSDQSVIDRLDGFRIEYNVIATNLHAFLIRENIQVTLEEISNDCQHSLFIREVPVAAYVKTLELLIGEADKQGICCYRRNVPREISAHHRDILSTLLCHIGWEGLSALMFCLKCEDNLLVTNVII